MAAALDAAHQAGVVHRDFKCSNVMLLPSARRASARVVTDFGLAARRRGPRRAGLADAARRDSRHAGLHGARADRGRRGHAGHRHLRARHRDVRDARRRAPVPRRPADGRRRSSACARHRARRASCPGPRSPLGPAIMRCLARVPRIASSAPATSSPPCGERRAAQASADVRRGAAPCRGGVRPGRRLRLPRPPARRRARSGDRPGPVRRRPERAPALDRRPRVPERLRAAGRRLAVDRIRRDADDRAGRRRAAADDPRREHRPHEDRVGLADADTTRPTRSAASAILGSDLVVLGSYRVGRPGSGTIRLDARLQDSGRAARWRWSARPAPKRKC